MANFTLDDIRKAADAKYGSTNIDGTELVNPLRLTKEKRAALTGLQGKLDAEDADQEEILAEALQLVSRTEAQGETLLAGIGGDLAVLVSVFEKYMEGAQVGEASPSQS